MRRLVLMIRRSKRGIIWTRIIVLMERMMMSIIYNNLLIEYFFFNNFEQIAFLNMSL